MYSGFLPIWPGRVVFDDVTIGDDVTIDDLGLKLIFQAIKFQDVELNAISSLNNEQNS